MGHACRVCEKTFARSRDAPTYCNVLVDVAALVRECVEVELDLRDSFNACCFTCRHISMSVPSGVSVDAQLCYLKSQVICFGMLKSYGLVVDEC